MTPFSQFLLFIAAYAPIYTSRARALLEDARMLPKWSIAGPELYAHEFVDWWSSGIDANRPKWVPDTVRAGGCRL